METGELKVRVDTILNRRPAVGLAVGVVHNGSLESFHGHGLADIASNSPITEDTVFRIGSITKTFTAVAVMQLWEQGLVDLDAPANHYLRAHRLFPATPSFGPATVRHLLTHTAGIREVLHPLDFAPLSFQKQPTSRNLPSWVTPARGALPVPTAATALRPRRKRSKGVSESLVTRRQRSSGRARRTARAGRPSHSLGPKGDGGA